MKKIILLICLPLFTFSQNITDSLLLYYPMNGNAQDFSGNNFHGTVVGASPIQDRFGNDSSAYYFDGINDYIDFPLNDTLKPAYPLTIVFWAKLDIVSLLKSKFINTDYVPNDYFGVGMNVNDLGELTISFGGGNGFTNPSNRITFSATTMIVVSGVWYNFTGVIHSATDMDLYINCEDVQAMYSSGTGNTTIAYTNYAPGNLGRSDGTGPAQYYSGTMDELKYWNRALTPTEISSLCEGTFNYASWDCINNSCINLGNLSGSFSDSLTCVTSCIVPSWDCIDNICVDPGNGSGIYTALSSCLSVCIPTSVDELNKGINLLRIVDVLGRETKKESNIPLFYFYDDGTVEKKIIIE